METTLEAFDSFNFSKGLETIWGLLSRIDDQLLSMRRGSSSNRLRRNAQEMVDTFSTRLPRFFAL